MPDADRTGSRHKTPFGGPVFRRNARQSMNTTAANCDSSEIVFYFSYRSSGTPTSSCTIRLG